MAGPKFMQKSRVSNRKGVVEVKRSTYSPFPVFAEGFKWSSVPTAKYGPVAVKFFL